MISKKAIETNIKVEILALKRCIVLQFLLVLLWK